ncbi:hypothetical protein O9929_18095 [Vibrio lentus]|nr:hypothetical protein [Vibrio lentus]
MVVTSSRKLAKRLNVSHTSIANKLPIAVARRTDRIRT